MKFQYLAVIFIIIVLPISMVLSVYIQNQVVTIERQISFDSKLTNATYDAIKVFQMNTASSSTSDIVNSKLRDIEAAANSFYTSLESNFSSYGYNTEALKEYVPALVFTMYDGFYIYSTYENILDDNITVEDGSTYEDEDIITELKPYITYSCRYIKDMGAGMKIDIIITYSLDNYITIDGYIYNDRIHDAGYLLDDVSYENGVVTYRGVQITPESGLKENVGNEEYEYIEINGVKYYEDNDGSWFTLLNGERIYTQTLPDRNRMTGELREGNDINAYLFYKEAAEFKERLESYGSPVLKGAILQLTPNDAVNENGEKLSELTNENNEVVYDFTNTESIFTFNNNGISIEDSNSNFNEHRRAIMRYVIEKNLSVALANYSNIQTGTYEFKMPKLSEEDWDKILNNVSLISFLQGLSIGGKIYNGYSVINNNKNEEVVTEDSLYIIANDNMYHRVNEKGLKDIINNNSIGVFNMDLERKSITNTIVSGSSQASTAGTIYYFPKVALGSYTSIITQTNVETTDNLLEYLEKITEDDLGGNGKALAKLYYTALGRERYGMYKVFRNPSEHINYVINGGI